MDGDEFYTLLHAIAEGLDAENIRMIRYLCKDCIPKNKIFQNGFELLQYMEDNLWITKSDMEFLAEVLYWIKRRDLLKRLPGVKSRQDYEANYLLKDRYFSTFRITCFVVTQELLPEDFRVLKNFCRNKLSSRNYQRSEDIYQLLDCLEEEDVFSEGDLAFMILCLRRLDNQKPYKLFENLSLGDHSLIYPSRESSQTQQTRRAGFTRQVRSLPAFTDQYAPQVYHVTHASFHDQPYYAHALNSTNEESWSEKSDNISADGCAEVRLPVPVVSPVYADACDNKFFTEQDLPPAKQNTYREASNCKSFFTSSDESNPKTLLHTSRDATSTDTSLKQTLTSSNYPSSTEKAFSGNPSATDAQCQNSYFDSSVQPISHLASVSGEFFTMSLDETDSIVPSERYTTAGSSIGPSSILKDPKVQIGHYEMNHSPTGICLIINNRNFENYVNVAEAKRRLQLQGHDYPVPNVGLKNRVGSAQDIQKVSDLFKSFGFEVIVHEDLDSRDMLKQLQTISRKNHSAYDCFVLIIMSHGALGSIYGVDGMPVRCSEIKSIFKPTQCPTLLNKPKIFFFQACQGEQTMEGHSTAPVADVTDIETDGHGVLPVNNTPSEADFLICYSTVPGYISYRSRTNGSFFINFVVDSLKTLHATEDVLSIMTHVNLELANHSLNQTAMPVSTLRKKVFFKQQNPS